MTEKQRDEIILQTQEEVKSLSEKMVTKDELKEELLKRDVILLQIQKEITSISRSVAVIEKEHGEKLQALFDIFTAHSEKFEEHDKRITRCENKLERHSAEIYCLKRAY